MVFDEMNWNELNAYGIVLMSRKKILRKWTTNVIQESISLKHDFISIVYKIQHQNWHHNILLFIHLFVRLKLIQKKKSQHKINTLNDQNLLTLFILRMFIEMFYQYCKSQYDYRDTFSTWVFQVFFFLFFSQTNWCLIEFSNIVYFFALSLNLCKYK